MAKLEEPVEIRLLDLEVVQQIIQDFKEIALLVEMYQAEIESCPAIPAGFCKGGLFQEKLKILEKYKDDN